jgi:UDP-N-acetylmuramate--alanine ligase
LSLSIDGKELSVIHFAGILGSGMSALAQFCSWLGCTVSGSDRMIDKEESSRMQAGLLGAGCRLGAQDGSAVSTSTQAVVVSTAIEESNPDIAAARRLGVSVLHRSDVLAAIVAGHETVAVAGTSGKSTVTALCFELLAACGKDPSLITGAPLKRLEDGGLVGNAYRGTSRLLVIEADESDGTLVKYRPAVGVVLNVSKDHKPVDETLALFQIMCRQSAAVVIGADDPAIAGLPHRLTFGLQAAADVHPDRIDSLAPAITFSRAGQRYTFPQVGRHNLQNLLAAIAVGELLGCQAAVMASAAARYQGLDRRFTIVGAPRGVTVIDDYAHNPEKIRAALDAARTMGGRVFAVFQPHGFGPTRFMHAELVDTFAATIRPGDAVAILPIYYAGGTAQKDISSKDLVDEIAARGTTALAPTSRAECCARIGAWAQRGDVVLVMGARDPSLAIFAKQIAETMEKQEGLDRVG